MTLQEFRASGTDCADIGNHPIMQDESLIGVAGRTYINSGYDVLYIEKLASGEWCLTIGNMQETAPLADLEAKLYAFAVSEGYFS